MTHFHSPDAGLLIVTDSVIMICGQTKNNLGVPYMVTVSWYTLGKSVALTIYLQESIVPCHLNGWAGWQAGERAITFAPRPDRTGPAVNLTM